MPPRLSASNRALFLLIRRLQNVRHAHTNNVPISPSAVPPPRPRKPSRNTSLISTAILFVFTTHLLLRSIRGTEGASMIPTLYLEDRALVLTHYRRGRGVKVGDVVSAQHPHEPGETVIKRVVGMPGDFVCGGMDPESGGPLLQVPQGHCFLAGDNQAFSRDSRYYGPVPLALVRGRAVAVASKMRWLGDPFTRVAEGDLVG